MANLALAWVNRCKTGTWTASGQLTDAPVSRLNNKHVNRKWRVNASSGHIVCDFGSEYSVDTIALIGLNEGSQPTRVKLSTADSSGSDGSAHDSGALSDPWDSDYLPYIHKISSPVTARYLRIELDTSASYVEAGVGFAGLRSVFDINFAPGWAPPYFTDPSIDTVGRGGQTFTDDRDLYRTCSVTLPFVSETQLNDMVRAINMLGRKQDVLFMTDPDSDNLGRDSIWGYFENDDPPLEPQIVSASPMFSKTYRIRERL